jgi:hypothetical protein
VLLLALLVAGLVGALRHGNRRGVGCESSYGKW